MSFLVAWLALLAIIPSARAASRVEDWANQVDIPAESAEAAAQRHNRVAERRAQLAVICHRGAWEFAHENTLEAYRATFELGADGNEIDIRATKDGVLICFHDDMLDHILKGYGDTPEYTWDQLRRIPFRYPGPFGADCRIPTLVEVLDLHRRYGGLIQLDIKRPGLDAGIATLLDRMDMWDHIIVAPSDIGAAVVKDARFRGLNYKASMYEDHSDLFPDTIARALAKPGDMLMVEDPRGVLFPLGRKWHRPSREPVSPIVLPETTPAPNTDPPNVQHALERLRNADDWDKPLSDPAGQAQQAESILARARAADEAARGTGSSPELIAALEERVRNRALHFDWRYIGLDGAQALRALFALGSDRAVPLARFVLWRDDPALVAVQNPVRKNPRSWIDFRAKLIVFDLLLEFRPPGTAELCREYLAQSESTARELGILQFDPAAEVLLSASPHAETAVELLKHPRQDVRGRAILVCLRHQDEPWARTALETAAPHALNYYLPVGSE